MDDSKKNLTNIYSRVMPRINLQSRKSTDNRSVVTRHKKSNKSSPSIVSPYKVASNFSSGVISELPIVLDDYDNTARTVKSAKCSNVVKPRKTLESLDVTELPPKATALIRNARVSLLKSRGSAPSVVDRGPESWTCLQSKTCLSSRSHTKLRDIQEEISSFRKTEKQMRLRAKLFKSCGVVLDDIGNVKEDKATQAERGDNDQRKRREPWDSEVNLKGDMSDQHMKVALSKYPLDRYLDDRNDRCDVDNIIPNDIWRVEPSLKPEDEMVLRQLHDMLKHTAEDLKLLSAEMNQFKEPKVIVKSDPIPLDEEFNQKVHIEEVVSAKIHGNTIVESKPTSEIKKIIETNKDVKAVEKKVQQPKIIKKANRNLAPTKIKVLQIDSESEVKEKISVANVKKNKQTIAEYTFKHEVKKPRCVRLETLTVHHMPSVNIRSELKEQKVLHIDIVPDKEINDSFVDPTRNVGVIEVEHGENRRNSQRIVTLKAPTRKVSKLSTCESSESANNISSDTQHRLQTQIHLKNIIRTSPKTSARSVKSINNKKEKITPKKPENYLNEWKRKLSHIYGNTASMKEKKQQPKNVKKDTKSQVKDQTKSYLNNKEYIPYSQLTLGGVTLSDLEREVSDTPIKNDIPLSPIIDKILSSKENSPRKIKNASPRILTTSDENLLHEVMDIEKQVQKTVSKTKRKKTKTSPKRSQQKINIDVSQDNESYDDDFEDIEKSESNADSQETVKSSRPNGTSNSESSESESEKSINKNQTYTKLSNLTIKESVDIHEFVHLVETNENATQMKSTIRPQGTQTSPKDPIKPIHNDLWSSIDPKQEVEKLFKSEKDLIKKLIVEEYGDLFEKNIAKPSTSQSGNLKSSQKNTQTSPAHVKNTTTSPINTKTRTTSPLNLKKDTQTSPVVELDEVIAIEIDPQDLASSVNLSSPRFSLRLPQTSRDVLSNLESGKTFIQEVRSKNSNTKLNIHSSSSSEVESSSDVSSLGEIKYVLRERLRKTRMVFTDSSTTSLSDYPSGSILPLKSDGEISFGNLGLQKQSNLSNKDKSLGQL